MTLPEETTRQKCKRCGHARGEHRLGYRECLGLTKKGWGCQCKEFIGVLGAPSKISTRPKRVE